MKVWRFNVSDDCVEFGGVKRKKLTPDGCNEPYGKRFWCPRRRWFLTEACPFVSRQECDSYRRMCGAI